MKQDRLRGTIRSGYKTWMMEPSRASSNEVKHGAWWRTDGAYWRVSWIEATNEFYAAELGKTDRFVFLGNFEKKDIDALMRLWFDGDNLGLLIQKCSDRIGSHSE